jgi:hypothetical protein
MKFKDFIFCLMWFFRIVDGTSFIGKDGDGTLSNFHPKIEGSSRQHF